MFIKSVKHVQNLPVGLLIGCFVRSDGNAPIFDQNKMSYILIRSEYVFDLSEIKKSLRIEIKKNLRMTCNFNQTRDL